MRVLMRRSAPEGPVVLGPVLLHPAHHEEGGEGLVGELEEGVVLVVLEEDVVEGAVGLDEVGLEEEGLHLVPGGDEV